MIGEVRLSELTTLHVGGPAQQYLQARDEATLVATVTEADAAGRPVLVLGGGSNLLVADSGFPGLVVQVETEGIQAVADGGTVRATVAAGVPWDELVTWSLMQGLAGLEALSGIPGLVGASPIQNVGAYGAEVASVISGIRVLDRSTGLISELQPEQAEFGYRMSRFKREAGRWLVLAVTFRLPRGTQSAPIRYGELARTLGVAVGDRVPATAVREAVLQLRRGKGMVVDPRDHDTWSAGSFFTNPIITPDQAAGLPEGVPAYPAGADRVKVSAAWLIDRAGFTKGYRLGPDAPAALSSKHTLALTNRGGATAADLLELARHIQAGVRERFGITLENEPVLVGCAL